MNLTRYISLAVIIAAAIVAYLALQKPFSTESSKKTDTTPSSNASKLKGTKTMKISMKTSLGTVMMELYPEKAPITVKNFIQYIESGHFNGTVFHRVIPGFMVQGGGFEPGMKQKDVGTPIKNEADNGLGNEAGTLAMARTPDPDSATAQFFINLKDNTFLNYSAPTAQGWGYCVFGKVTEGMDVIHSIEKVSTGSAGMHQDVPVEDVMIEEMTVIKDEAE